MTRSLRIFTHAAWFVACAVSGLDADPGADKTRREEYIQAVTRGDGAGLLPWQKPGPGAAEIEFRQGIEARKTALLQNRSPVQHPALFDADAKRRALENIRNSEQARALANRWRAVADDVVSQPGNYVERMIEELTPWHG